VADLGTDATGAHTPFGRVTMMMDFIRPTFEDWLSHYNCLKTLSIVEQAAGLSFHHLSRLLVLFHDVLT